MKFDSTQKQAIDLAMNDEINMMFISGSAGSGKTQVALEIEKQLTKDGWLVSKISPTGKAAILIGGKTIHSYLEPNVEVDRWGRFTLHGFNKTSLSNKECIIVDESSMIDDELWKEIMDVFNNTSETFKKKIIFIGDKNQLEPVGKGQPFIDHLKNDINVINFEKVYRQNEDNDIIVFANSILGKVEAKSEWNNIKHVTISDAITNTLKDIKNNQIICPLNKFKNGVNDLNLKIQLMRDLGEEAIDTIKFFKNEQGKFKPIKDKTIYIGDKIVVKVNNPALKVMNGTTGVITKKGFHNVKYYDGMRVVNKQMKGLFFRNEYDGKELFLPDSFAKTGIDLGYALTVHKFQGSQCKNVYFVLTEQQTMYLNNKMFYTGVTRAEEMLYLVREGE